jgi:lysophospholipase L1-like esterase
MKLRHPFLLTFPSLLAFAFTLGSAAPSPALDIQPHGSSIIVSAGQANVGGETITVTQAATLPIAPSPILTISDEALQLSPDKPSGYAKGTKLHGCNAKDVNAKGSFVPGSLELRKTKGGELLKEGEDYLLDSAWGMLGIGPKSRVTTQDTVFASYHVSLLRMDTVQVSADGKATLKQGEPDLSVPVPPAADPGCKAIAHVFTNYGATEVAPDAIYPIIETPAQAVTASTSGRIPKTLAKLKSGQPVTIVCLGDSVTVGGNASSPEFRYPNVFLAGLLTRFPQAKIDLQNISAGGSNSSHWLHPDANPYRGIKGPTNPARFERVIEAKPDLVTIEFVNDAGLSPAQVDEAYGDILKRLEPLGSEVILITPHFTMLSMMKFQTMRDTDQRPYVLALRDFATQHHLGLADASARWQHLAKEGIPYLTLLHNTINHPDNRGHQIFAEELWKNFR